MKALNKLMQPIRDFYNSIHPGNNYDYEKYNIKSGISFQLLERLTDENLEKSKRAIAFAEACGVNHNTELANIPLAKLNEKVEEYLLSLNAKVREIQYSEAKVTSNFELSTLDKEWRDTVEKESDPDKKVTLRRIALYNKMRNTKLSDEERKLAYCQLIGYEPSHAKHVTISHLEKYRVFNKAA